jgi:hypothetical protein
VTTNADCKRVSPFEPWSLQTTPTPLAVHNGRNPSLLILPRNAFDFCQPLVLLMRIPLYVPAASVEPAASQPMALCSWPVR